MARRTLLHVFATFGRGGPQRRFAGIANRFGRDYRHLIVAMDGVTDAIGLLAPELDAELLPLRIDAGNGWRNLKTFADQLAALNPDLLVTSNWGSIEWAMANLMRRVQHLHLEDGFGPDEADRQLPRRIWTRRIVLRRSIVVVPSRRLHEIARDVWRLPASRLFYVPNGIDATRFARAPDAAFAAGFGIRPNGLPVIGTVARLSPEKNLKRLIDAFALVLRQHTAVLVIVGDGPERAALAAYANALGLGNFVVCTGPCREPERLISSFSIFALSSDTEQMPLSVIEAMAAGRPVAATDVGDVLNMLSEENRPFVVPKSAEALSSALLGLLRDRCRATAIGAANVRRAHTLFDQTRMFAQYKALFDGKRPDPALLPGYEHANSPSAHAAGLMRQLALTRYEPQADNRRQL